MELLGGSEQRSDMTRLACWDFFSSNTQLSECNLGVSPGVGLAYAKKRWRGIGHGVTVFVDSQS